MIRRYIIRQFQEDKKHWYYSGTGLYGFSQRIDDSILFNHELDAMEKRSELFDEFEDLQVIAVKVKVQVVRAK